VEQRRRGGPSRLLALAIVLLATACHSAASWPVDDLEPKPSVKSFRFEPARLCYGDALRYRFDYQNIPGGLPTAQDVVLVARSRGTDRPMSLWALGPDLDERARHTAPNGSFHSGERYWRPVDPAPRSGVDLEVTLTVTLAYGDQVSGTTMVHFDGNCPAPLPSARGESRSGRLVFDTTTLSTRQFLTGAEEGSPARIWGDLRLPAGSGGRGPAVILVHGSEGVGRRETRWAEQLLAMGVAAFVLDSLTGRQFASATAEVSTGALIVDVYRALGFLGGHPRIDPTRVALMGFSRGGVVALYAGLDRFRRRYAPPGIEFAAHISFYPGCLLTYIDEGRVTDSPIRLFHGAADDWTAIGPCRDYVERLRRAGKDVELIEYAGARHAFDAPHLPPALLMPQSLNTARCSLVEQDGGEIVNRETGRPFAFTDRCVSRGATVGYDPHAHHQAIAAVMALLAKTFKLVP